MVRTVVGRAQPGVSEGLNGPYVLGELPSPSKALSRARKLVLVGEISGEPLDRARRAAGLTHGELYRRYFELGGMSSPLEWRRFVAVSSNPMPTTMMSLPMPSTSALSN